MVENLSNFVIGLLFGASLDLSGFGSAKKLNAQFLLRDFSMFKVMFGAIVVASSLYILFLKFGYPPVGPAVVPTLTLGIIFGGFLLGFGLVLGGYCPGTALTAIAGGRVDALVFFLAMYPGYKLWIWLEPNLFYNLNAPLIERNLTLPTLFGTSDIVVLLGLIVVCGAGWAFGSYVEKVKYGR